MNPLVSIIVPIYKVENYLDRCLDSIVNQSYLNIELILIDDGSPDNCSLIYDRYAREDNRITIIRKENGGLSDARNKGLDIAKGQYITFIDSDDFIHRDYVNNMVHVAEKYDCEVVQCEFEKGCLNVFSEHKRRTTIKVFDNTNIFYGRKLKITAWAKLYKRNIFSSLRFPVGKINEDEFITYKAIYEAKNIAIMSEPLYYYFQSPVSIMRGKNKVIKLDFICAYKERIAFFKEKNEHELVMLSKKEFALRAMLYYIKYHPNSSDINNQLIAIFQDNIKGLFNNRKILLYEKLVLMSFFLSPTISTYIVKKIMRL